MKLIDLKVGQTVHLMGICGTAMASLAGLLLAKGFRVTGSDSNPYPPMSTQLESLGVQIQKGYKAENLSHRPDFVIVGNVISATNPEAQELVRLKIPFASLPQAMGEFIIESRESIVISGTHGKTTTTSLMSWIAEEAGVQPGFLIGGIAKNFSKSFQNPIGNYFIIEGDEYDTAYFDKVPKFVHYRPKHVILTSIEFDHADIYADLDAVLSAFTKLLQLIPENGTLVYCAEDLNIKKILHHCRAKNIISYGLNQGDYQAQVDRVDEAKTLFSVLKKSSKTSVQYQMAMSGNYNVLNALACLAMSDCLGFDSSKVQTSLSTFLGVKRRQEVLGEPNQILIIEDFAHHPTAVRETIRGIQKKYHGRKFFSIFEPRSATSRRKVFQKDYVEAFLEADEIILARAFDQSKIDEGNRFSSDELIAELKSKGKKAHVFDSADQIVEFLVQSSKPGDGILIMSNGGFDGIYQKLISKLEQNSNSIS